LGGRYVHGYYMNSANTTFMPSRTTMDGAINVTHGSYDLTVNLVNLLDKERYYVSQINGGSQLYPGQPLNATVTVRYRPR
jgi:outer membrane receptor protein involved in Fe transport